MRNYKVGLIGFSIGGHVFHAPFIAGNRQLSLYKVTARRPEQQKLLRERYPEAIAVAHADHIINDADIDLVVIATSNDVHFALAKQALEAGKHVVVEKPFTNTTAEADALIALARKKGLLLTVHHNARFHSDFKTVKRIIDEGVLGPLVNYEARYDRFRNFLRIGAWREEDLPGSGIHYDLGAHLVDQALQLFGRPEWIFADLRKQRDGAKAVDDFEFILSYPRLKVSLKGQMLAKEPTARYALYGWNGSFVKPGIDRQEEKLREGAFPHEAADCRVEDASRHGRLSLLKDGTDIHEAVVSERGSGPDFYANVVAALNGGDLLVTAEQARDVIRVLEAAEESWEKKCAIRLTHELIAY